MKTIGLIGGLSWESTAEYYRLLNTLVKQRLGGSHSAQCLVWSFNFAEIEALQIAGDWAACEQRMIAAAQAVAQGGADCLVICSNTMHKFAAAVQDATNVPLLHIADAAAGAIHAQGLREVALLGTRYTMEQDYILGRLREQHGLTVSVPAAAERTIIHDIIYQELILGIINPASRHAYQQIMAQLVAQGAQGIILGCTEIELLIQAEHATVPVFPTTALHAAMAVDFALGE